MGKIIVTEFISLDGVIEDPGGAEGYKYGGWSFKVNSGEAGNKFKLDVALSSEALLLGRATYTGFAAAWPSVPGEFGDKFNSMPKYVVSSTLTEATWNNTTVIKGDVVEEAAKLRRRLHGDITVHGSAQLARTLIAHDLVDKLHLMVYPVLLGTGKRLFGETSDLKRLRLAEARTVGDGVVILIYESAGEKANEPVTN